MLEKDDILYYKDTPEDGVLAKVVNVKGNHAIIFVPAMYAHMACDSHTGELMASVALQMSIKPAHIVKHNEDGYPAHKAIFRRIAKKFSLKN